MKREDLKESDVLALQDCYENYVEEHPWDTLSFEEFVEQIIRNSKEVQL